MELRPYQREAMDSIYKYLQEEEGNPCAVLPTGSGKTILIATLVSDTIRKWQGRILVLSHVRELLEQSVDHIVRHSPELLGKIGVYSAGLKSRDTDEPCIVAGIQSVYKRALEFDAFDMVLIDEAHLISPDGETMYQSFLADLKKVNPNIRIIGLTATPFRMTTGMICGPDNILTKVVYDAGIRPLIVAGYLCPLICKAGEIEVDVSSLHVRGGEFIPAEVEQLMNVDSTVLDAVAEIVHLTKDRHSVLIFSSGIDHGLNIVKTLEAFGHEAKAVFGDTPSTERATILSDFKKGRLKYLINYAVLVAGFDAPNIDAIALLRPTLSPGLYAQSVGRALRVSPGKQNALILDYGGNVLRFGPIDDLQINNRHNPRGTGQAPAKQCPECRALVSTGYSICPVCGFIFPPPEKVKHDGKASLDGILSGQTTTEAFPVQHVYYRIHTKMGATEDDPKTMRVEYVLGLNHFVSEWVALEHTGWARQKAEQWWLQRRVKGNPEFEAKWGGYVPKTVKEAVELAEAGELCTTKSIVVKTTAGERYQQVVGYELENDLPAKEEVYEDITW